MHKFLLFTILLTLCSFTGFSQSNDKLDQILAQESLSAGSGAYLAVTAAGRLPDSADEGKCLEYCLQRGWLPAGRADSPLSLGEYALLLMKSFNLSGGIMYTLFPSPRYAARELGFKGFVLKEAGAYRTLDGHEGLSILALLMQEQRSGHVQ